MFITKAKHEAEIDVLCARLEAARDEAGLRSGALQHERGERILERERLEKLYREQLQDVATRCADDVQFARQLHVESEVGLEGRHAAELRRMQGLLDQQVTSSNALFGQLLAELRATREQSIELQRALLTLRREGFAEPLPAAARVEDVQLPAEVAAAIADVAFSPDVGAHLEQFAWEQVEKGTAPGEIVRMIKQGEDPAPVRPAAPTPSGRMSVVGGKVVGELPPDSPVAVMGDDNGDDDDDDE